MAPVDSGFKIVSVLFALSAVATGVQAIQDPVGFAGSFGIPISVASSRIESNSKAVSQSSKPTGNLAKSYVSLMGIRQLATGITLLVFAYQDKWIEMATILSILGFVVAGTDGLYLYQAGAWKKALFHAIPGAVIALLSIATVITNS